MTALFHINVQRPTTNHPMVHGSWFMVHGKTPPTTNHQPPTINQSLPTSKSSFLNPNSLPPRIRDGKAFTLVETALALLAISLGLLGIFGLARHGLRNAGDTENETRCTLLADTIIETLKAKNAELIAEGYSLNNWKLFWKTFAQNTTSTSTSFCYLPQMPDVSSDGTLLKIICGTHNLQDQLAESAREPDKWNPQYALSFVADPESQFLITLSIHPGVLQGGADWRTYYVTLGYAGGLP